jgi:hypothetical protein
MNRNQSKQRMKTPANSCRNGKVEFTNGVEEISSCENYEQQGCWLMLFLGAM